MTTKDLELTEEERALHAAEWFARDAPWARQRTHYATCYRSHPACAYAVGVDQCEEARSIAVGLEQELAELQRRCQALVAEWTRTGSMEHAAQLAEALELGADCD